MNQSQAKGFGVRGWILIIVLFLGFFSFQTFTNYPLNILAASEENNGFGLYGGSTTVATIMSVGTFIGIVIQLILSRFIGRIKSIKKVAAIFGIIAIVCAWIEAALPVDMVTAWYVVYFLVNLTITIYALFFLSIIAGQWFPRRKGTVMGISTIAYPFCNGVIGLFAASLGKSLAKTGELNVLRSFLPFLIAATAGLVLFLLLVTDYPEQVGAYRDNDKSFTPEVAKQMMEQEIEDKKTTVWTTGHIFACKDFWCAAVTCGLILMCAVGAMTQTNTIIGAFENLNYTTIMMVIAVFGAIGSWMLGMLDTALGTKRSMLICVILMVVSGICGILATATNTGALVVLSLILLAMFMGASSNYTVSVAVQYWRREDFAGVFACVNPIANIFNALAPTITAALLFAGGNVNVSSVFIMITIAGVVGIVLMLLFSGAHVKKVDDKYRAAAGKPLDDALVGRK